MPTTKRYKTGVTPTLHDLRKLPPVKRKTIWETLRLMIGLASEDETGPRAPDLTQSRKEGKDD
jgi:hypothetical protein